MDNPTAHMILYYLNGYTCMYTMIHGPIMCGPMIRVPLMCGTMIHGSKMQGTCTYWPVNLRPRYWCSNDIILAISMYIYTLHVRVSGLRVTL